MPLIDPTQKNNQSFDPNVDNSQIQAKANTIGKFITYLSFILLIPIFIYISSRNNLVRLQMKINEASSGIDVQLKKRKDTLTKLIDATKGSMKFEKDILTSITGLRTGTSNINALQDMDKDLARISGRVMATFEAYPNIKSTENVSQIIEAAEVIEQEIGATRRLYNSYVTEFNTRIFTWPGSVIASNMKLIKLPLFSASNEDKKDVEIKF